MPDGNPSIGRQIDRKHCKSTHPAMSRLHSVRNVNVESDILIYDILVPPTYRVNLLIRRVGQYSGAICPSIAHDAREVYLA